VIVTLPVPVLVRVTDCVPVVFTVTLPNATVDGEADSCRVTPVPDRDTVAGELVPLLVIEMLPVALPVVVGAKVALKLALCPPDKVSGSVSPVVPNPVPVTVAWVMVTLPVPVLLRVTGCVPVVFTVTLPNATVDGEAESCRVTPVPDRDTVAGESVALLVIEMLPVALPVVVGAKAALKLVLCPPERVSGSVKPLVPKPVPVTVA